MTCGTHLELVSDGDNIHDGVRGHLRQVDAAGVHVRDGQLHGLGVHVVYHNASAVDKKLENVILSWSLKKAHFKIDL